MNAIATKLFVATAATLTMGAALLLAAACVDNLEEGRFPICKSNDDCKARDAGDDANICWNLKCVECMYDVDCPAGSFCNASKECKPLSPAATEDPGPKGWDPATFDECIKTCKDKDCVDICNKRFPEKKPRRR